MSKFFDLFCFRKQARLIAKSLVDDSRRCYARWVGHASVTLTCVLTLSSVPARSEEIWFGATEPVWRAVRKWPQNDWMQLFQMGAPWQHAMATVDVVELSKRAVLETSDSDLQTVIKFLQSRKIRLAVQATPLIASQTCGLGIEGHGPVGDMMTVAARLKQLGADLSYITMDEPLFFGHLYSGNRSQKPCHSSIAEIAHQTAVTMRAMRTIYPNAVIGDDEPIAIPEANALGWPEEIQVWLRAYRAEMGEPLGFFHADVVWARPTWPTLLNTIVGIVRKEHITLGLIYNGTPFDRSDSDWVNDAALHYEAAEGYMRLKPDQVKFQSWMDRPREMLPETKPGTMTNLILRYEAWRQKDKPRSASGRYNSFEASGLDVDNVKRRSKP